MKSVKPLVERMCTFEGLGPQKQLQPTKISYYRAFNKPLGLVILEYFSSASTLDLYLTMQCNDVRRTIKIDTAGHNSSSRLLP